MRRFVTATLALGLLGPALWALDEPKEKAKADKPATPEKAYQAIIQEYQKAQQDFFKAYREAKTDEERNQAVTKSPKQQDYADRLMKLAKEHPTDPAAEKALIWVVQNAG